MIFFQETIDDDMQDHSSVKMVKIDDDEEADEYGLTVRPGNLLCSKKLYRLTNR